MKMIKITKFYPRIPCGDLSVDILWQNGWRVGVGKLFGFKFLVWTKKWRRN